MEPVSLRSRELRETPFAGQLGGLPPEALRAKKVDVPHGAGLPTLKVASGDTLRRSTRWPATPTTAGEACRATGRSSAASDDPGNRARPHAADVSRGRAIRGPGAGLRRPDRRPSLPKAPCDRPWPRPNRAWRPG